MRLKFRLHFICVLLALAGTGLQPNRDSYAQDQETIVPELIISAQWHPQGNGLLISGRAGMEEWGLWVYDANLQPVRFFPNPSPVSASWSPDGTRFAMGRRIIAADTLELLLDFDANSGIGGWNADGSQVLAWVNETTLGFYDSTNGSLLRSLSVGTTIPDAVSWSPDSRFLLYVQPTGMIDVIDALTGNRLTTFPLEYQYPLGLNWSADSRYLAAGFIREAEPGEINILPDAASPTVASVLVWDAVTGSKIHQFDGLMAAPSIIRWNPQRSELSAGTGLGLIYVWDMNTGQQLDVLTTVGGLSTFDYSPFSGRLFIGTANTDSTRAGLLDSRRESLVEQESYYTQTIIRNVMEVLVPNPSMALLEQVEAACVPRSVDALLPTVDRITTAGSYIQAVEQNDAISPGCRADLLAVATALQASP
ncbi:MAG: WD40 repeat domain-containing protein [Anaerolineae bacterium]|nr:WD40 repeat domain-containing protein [Anaerolineae bacterium]